jgi:hypothetical protein
MSVPDKIYFDAHKFFVYDKETGILYNKIDRGKAKSGSVAGSYGKHARYLSVMMLGKKYYVHRIAWLMSYGEFPQLTIDHINHNRLDNRLINLRVVSSIENKRNQKQHITNSSGITGVYFETDRNKWHSQIKVIDSTKHLGRFNDLFSAVCARKSAEIHYGFHENHGGVI